MATAGEQQKRGVRVSTRGSVVRCASHGAGLPSAAQGAGRDTGRCTGGRAGERARKSGAVRRTTCFCFVL